MKTISLTLLVLLVVAFQMSALDPNYGNALNPAQLRFMAPEKPPEELYDVTADPHEINNLANSPQHQAILKQMRAALGKWQKETKDLGGVPEMELRERMRPGGVWQKVAAPTVSETEDLSGSPFFYSRLLPPDVRKNLLASRPARLPITTPLK